MNLLIYYCLEKYYHYKYKYCYHLIFMIYECNVFRSRILYAVILVFCLTFVRHLISCNFSSYGGGLQVRLIEEGVQGKYLTLSLLNSNFLYFHFILYYQSNNHYLLSMTLSFLLFLLLSVLSLFLITKFIIF